VDLAPHTTTDPARPAPRPAASDYLRRTVAWIGPRRIATSLALAVAVGVGGWWLLHAPQPPVERALPRATAPATTAASALATNDAAPPPVSTVTPGVVVVHVAGAVARPGLVSVPAPARVADVVVAAGGTTDEADPDALNLAAPVSDGTRIYVPRRGEVDPGAVPTAPPSAGTGSGSAAPSGPLDVNSASAAQLEELPGIGPATAAAIIAHREANGPFRSVDDLLDVRGIGPAKLAQFRAFVTT
jgi:competence protein ComEA